jgi:hypothetical protein
VIADTRRQWYWREDEAETADEQEIYYVATIRDGLICRWAPFEDREDAVRAAGVKPET